MIIRSTKTIPESKVTDYAIWRSRREFIKKSSGLTLGLGLGVHIHAAQSDYGNQKLSFTKNSAFSTNQALTDYEDITQYNNFYEFGTSKKDPARRAKNFNTRPWSIKVDGECEQPGYIDMEDILKEFPQEERIYRLRCVEAWSMVIPWVGFPLASLLKRFKPNSQAKYVAFETLHDSDRMPGQIRRVLDWPYREGLRIDEAMHPLTLLATGLYGEVLPNQNGAPIRLVVPWKYGFKSIKSIVAIRFVDKQPMTTWNELAKDEYGFYANVNPNVDHPRWSQKYHRNMGEGLFAGKEKTQLFNGYAEQVESLYSSLDLTKYY